MNIELLNKGLSGEDDNLATGLVCFYDAVCL